MVICIELYTSNPDIHSYACIIIHYNIIRKLCDVIIQKLKFVIVKLSFNAYNILNFPWSFIEKLQNYIYVFKY